jgi:molybdopterin molybdotransferase
VDKGSPGKGKDRPGLTGFSEALDLVRRHIRALPDEEIPLDQSLHRTLAGEAAARVSSPTHDVSLKDGFAVMARDTSGASETEPVTLRLGGSRFAGKLAEEDRAPRVSPGGAVRVTSGAVLPKGADAVVGSEYCEELSGEIRMTSPVTDGKNVLPMGTDIRAEAVLGKVGELLSPGRVGWLAAAGVDRVRVFRVPRVALVATGDEVVAPGTPLKSGQLYASNLCTLMAWLRVFGISSNMKVLPDRRDVLIRELPPFLDQADVLLTSGGAWGSERDLVIQVLDELGWRKVFHRVRLGPGKAVGFGLLGSKPVFCLPGGPPSNEMAFLQLALPGVLRLMGRNGPPFPVVEARLTEPLKGREIDWTQIRRGRIEQAADGSLRVTPYRPPSRLQSMALADCLIELPEGVERLEAGGKVRVQLLSPPESFAVRRVLRPGGPDAE